MMENCGNNRTRFEVRLLAPEVASKLLYHSSNYSTLYITVWAESGNYIILIPSFISDRRLGMRLLLFGYSVTFSFPF